jgi:hypothetical protein
MNEVYFDSMKSTFQPNDNNDFIRRMSPVTKLQFSLNASNISAIKTVKEKFHRKVDPLTIEDLHYVKYGRDFLKSKQMSPDAIMQLSFQMAFYDQYGFMPSMYETCDVAVFKHGRIDIMRPITWETAQFAKAFVQGKRPSKNLLKLLQAVTVKHKKIIQEAALGFDTHLLALSKLAEGKGQFHSLFEDKSYQFLQHTHMFTSTVPQIDAVQHISTGPESSDGYGVTYMTDPKKLRCTTTAYPTRDALGFVKRVECSLDFIYDTLK